LAETLAISAPATSANLGPGFDALAIALDLSNTVRITRRPGPLEVLVTGEGEGELPGDEENLVCQALLAGVEDLDGLLIECRNRIPLGRGLGSSAATVCAGLVAANALGLCRWSPDDLLERAITFEGHADNAAACLLGGAVAVAPGAPAQALGVPEGLALVAAIPEARISTDEARGALPEQVPLRDAADTLARAVALALALSDGRVDDLPPLLRDALHEPYRAPSCDGLEALRELAGKGPCLGVTISGSGPTSLLWARAEGAEEVEESARAALREAGVAARTRICRPTRAGVRARWLDEEEHRLAKAVG
jgi:homoserine kinase